MNTIKESPKIGIRRFIDSKLKDGKLGDLSAVDDVIMEKPLSDSTRSTSH